MIFFLHILELWHTVDIDSKVKPNFCESFTLTCTVVCEFPGMMVNWVYADGQTIRTTDMIRVEEASDNRRYVVFTTKKITFNPLLTIHAKKYKCISSYDIRGLQSQKEKSHLLTVSGTHRWFIYNKYI